MGSSPPPHAAAGEHRELPWWIAPAAFAATLVVRALRATVRLRFHGEATIRAWEAGDQRFLLAFWHRHLPLMRYAYRGRRMTVLVSRSKDGELIARVMRHFGIATSRGSSSRGGSAGLRDLLRASRAGSDLAITPDGPRGPLREVQPGVVLLAALSGLPLIPVALGASRARELASWDRMPLPLPGSRVEVVYGEPIRVPRDAEVETWAPRLREALNEVERRAGELAAGRTAR